MRETIRGTLNNGRVQWHRQTNEWGEQDGRVLQFRQLDNLVKTYNGWVEVDCEIDVLVDDILQVKQIYGIRYLTKAEVDEMDIVPNQNNPNIGFEEILNQRLGEEASKTPGTLRNDVSQCIGSRIQSTPAAKAKNCAAIEQSISTTMRIRLFINNETPQSIEDSLNQYIIGQPNLTYCAAEFLYYHALRQIHPELPPRPMLISGPSGSGKTEVWRVIKKLYGDLFPIKIINGARITEDGWKGDYKLFDQIEPEMINGGILIVDEFDKLSKPRHNATGENVSSSLQSEFLKMLEGEEILGSSSKKSKMPAHATTAKMGFVLVGAFEDMRNDRNMSKIGFGNFATLTPQTSFTDEDYINFGLLPELVGRIATKCETNVLSNGHYLQIIKSPHSRVSKLINVLNKYGVQYENCTSDEDLIQLVETSKSNKTGVRWVAAKVEQQILNQIHARGILKSEYDKSNAHDAYSEAFTF